MRTLVVILALSGCAVGIGYDPNPDESGCVEGAEAKIFVPGAQRMIGDDCGATDGG